MVPREVLRSRRFLVLAALTALGALLALLFLAAGCPGDKERLRQRVRKLEREKKTAEASAARWKAESKAKTQYLLFFTGLLNEVANRIDQIQQDQQGLAALTVQGAGDTWRIVKNKEIPQALDRIDEQLQKNREQIGQLEALATTKSAEFQALNAVLERFKRQNELLDQQLQALRRSLGALSKKVKTLETKVVSLETEVDEREKVIGDKEKVIGEKETQLTEKSRQLESAETEKWTRFYAVETRKELCRLAIIAPCGIMSSVRKARLADRHVEAFEKCGVSCRSVDARVLHEIVLGRTRGHIEIMPPPPSDSFKVEKRDGESYLLIQKVDEFWKYRYLAVLIER